MFTGGLIRRARSRGQSSVSETSFVLCIRLMARDMPRLARAALKCRKMFTILKGSPNPQLLCIHEAGIISAKHLESVGLKKVFGRDQELD